MFMCNISEFVTWQRQTFQELYTPKCVSALRDELVRVQWRDDLAKAISIIDKMRLPAENLSNQSGRISYIVCSPYEICFSEYLAEESDSCRRLKMWHLQMCGVAHGHILATFHPYLSNFYPVLCKLNTSPQARVRSATCKGQLLTWRQEAAICVGSLKIMA